MRCGKEISQINNTDEMYYLLPLRVNFEKTNRLFNNVEAELVG